VAEEVGISPIVARSRIALRERVKLRYCGKNLLFTYGNGISVSWTSAPAAGWRFQEWSGACSCTADRPLGPAADTVLRDEGFCHICRLLRSPMDLYEYDAPRYVVGVTEELR
jgi:hypothetical protein